MLLQRIKAHNYRTYVDLDLNLEVSPEKPIVLIGGANGGGKTTLFHAIAGALYGLHIPDSETFKREINAGALAAGHADLLISLELWFTGQILAQQQQYVLTRTWVLNSEGKVNWGVKFNMAGNVFTYGSATADKERVMAEVQVNKIIKANLPRELSQYFLFDAMSAGEKLSEDQLGKVIRENIENVMGLRKYLDLGLAAREVQESRQASRFRAQAEREEYILLTNQQRVDEARLREMEDAHERLLGERQGLRDLVQELQQMRDQEGTLKRRLEQMEKQKNSLLLKEGHLHEQLEEFVKVLEISVGLPYLANAMQGEIRAWVDSMALSRTRPPHEALHAAWGDLVHKVYAYLEERGAHLAEQGYTEKELLDYLLQQAQRPATSTENPDLDESEWRALENVLQSGAGNAFPALDLLRQELRIAIAGLPILETQTEDLRVLLAGKDYSSLVRFDALGNQVQLLEKELDELRKRMVDNTKKIQQFDVSHMEGPDLRFDAVCKLKSWFEDAANELLKAKKHRIEATLRDDLNRNLAAYRGVIERVELSENLRSLTFRIFHKAGNEIYLGQLNAASKQVVIQVLLKALHESGDYDPPVMIDTVMGVLDRESRATILENYFPELSHQTILLSTDSEIDPDRDWKCLEPYVGKAWTLVRDREAQRTEAQVGYFGQQQGA